MPVYVAGRPGRKTNLGISIALLAGVLVGCESPPTKAAQAEPDTGSAVLSTATVNDSEAFPITATVPATEEAAAPQILLTIGDRSMTATLVSSPTARDFAKLLPVTIRINDLLGQEKTGDLPRGLDESGDPVFTYEIGQIGYWAPGESIAFLYAVLGDGAIPEPGLIPIGTLDAGPEMFAAAEDGASLVVSLIN